MQLPPLSKWKSKSYKATEATGAGVKDRWYGNVQVAYWEPGLNKATVYIYGFTPEGKHYTKWHSPYGIGLTGKEARATAQAYLDANPGAFELWPNLKWPPPSYRKPSHHALGLKGYTWLGKTPAMSPDTVVRLKIVGGTDRSTLFKGHDSKGRAKYELPIPAGKTAHDVAKSIKAVAKAGAHEVLGGTVYAIRFFTPGKGEFDYWKAK